MAERTESRATVRRLAAGRASHPTGARRPTAARPPAAAATPPLDETSKAIIEQLQEDGRRSYAAIAKAVGLSEAAVRQRVTRLLDTGVMQIVAVTDPLQVGFRRQAMVGVRVEGDVAAVADRLTAIPEVDYVVLTAGSFDLLVELVCEDDDHLLSILDGEIRSTPGVRSTETFVYLKLAKQTYTWGTR
jgi:Lrp/AsnC family transcriptional regulator for asnA, asnC and gidA